MKHKIKYVISDIIKYSYSSENKISIQNLSIYMSVLIATLSLRIKHSDEKINTTYHNYRSDFKCELQLIKQRFPELIKNFNNTEPKLKEEFALKVFESLKYVFDEIDDDLDDLISWSYQYLKKDLEKIAFKKIGKNKAKIQNSDLLYTTQFFTDRYMVKYLVDESLTGIDIKNIPKIVVIDPASGGGNFLTYSFERLYKFYIIAKPNYTSQKIVDTILNNVIIGYDLDYNLSKIASLSLFVKACSYAVPNKSTQINIFGGMPNDKLGFLNPDVISNSINRTTFKTQLEEIDKEKKIKVFVTNPPFMGKRDMDTSLKKYLLSKYPQSKGDLCVSFIQRIIQVMNVNDVLGVVSQNNWMYLSSLKEYRKLFLEKQILKECVDLGSKAFEDINGEKTNVALCIIVNSGIRLSRFYNLKLRNLTKKRDFLTKKSIPSDLTFELNQNRFSKNSNFEFNYQLEHRFKNIQKLPLYSHYAKPMQGTSTGNNAEFVKYSWEVNGNPEWKIVSKGGGFSKWAGLNYYKVHWGEKAEIIKANKGSALRNVNKISSTQLVFSDTGTLGLNVRVLKDNQVFIASGPGIQVLKGDKYAHLAFLNSRVATFLLKLINPKFTISAGYISKIPVVQTIFDSKLIVKNGKKCLELKNNYLKRKLPNFEFQHYDYDSIKDCDSFIEQLIIEDVENDYQLLLLESKIEIEIKKQYNFNLKELTEIKSMVGESPFFTKKKSIQIDSDKLDLLLSSSINLNCMSTSRAVTGYTVGGESLLEALSCKLEANPKSIFDLIKINVSSLQKTKVKYFNDLLHKIILNELCVKQVSMYKFNIVNTQRLIEKIKLKYKFLKYQPDLNKHIFSILSNHHKISFFNKPLISISGESITIGQLQNG